MEMKFGHLLFCDMPVSLIWVSLQWTVQQAECPFCVWYQSYEEAWPINTVAIDPQSDAKKLEAAKLQKLAAWCTIYRVKANNFGATGNNLTKLVRVVCRKAGMKIWVHIFGGMHY